MSIPCPSKDDIIFDGNKLDEHLRKKNLESYINRLSNFNINTMLKNKSDYGLFKKMKINKFSYHNKNLNIYNGSDLPDDRSNSYTVFQENLTRKDIEEIGLERIMNHMRDLIRILDFKSKEEIEYRKKHEPELYEKSLTVYQANDYFKRESDIFKRVLEYLENMVIHGPMDVV